MITARSCMILAAILLGGCATGNGRPVERTVFNNPFSGLATDRTGIGPQCEANIGRDGTCLDPRNIVARRGRFVTLRNGDTVRLTRAQAQTLRERAALIAASRNQPPSIPPPPPAPPPPPIAESGSETP